MSKMNVACLLTSWYSMSLEATLQATGFEDDVVDFINGNVDAKDDEVSSALVDAEARSWAAQHISQWRRCAKGDAPLLVFQDDVFFASDSTNVFEATKGLVREGMTGCKLIAFLGAAAPDEAPSQEMQQLLANTTANGVAPARSASPTPAYILWPMAARALLDLLPLEVAVPEFLNRQVSEGKVLAIAAVPALVQ
jgi:hypothetical protein